MARRLHRPSPALVVACIALFVALSGFGYAAIKLPRNSVGTKQLKNSAVTGKKIAKRAVSGAKIAPDAVTGDKVADNSLTGADVLESSLGRVPSATNATNATNATTVGGLAPSVFARASRFYVGAGNPTAAAATPIVSIPNAIRVETDGDGDNTFEVRFVNLTADTWDLTTSQSNGLTSIPPNGSVFVGAQPTNGFTYFGRDTAHLDRYLMVTCGYVGNTPTNQIECYAEVSAALG